MEGGESVVDLDDASLPDDRDDVDSLPSLSTSDVYSDSDAEAQAEWERSLEQLQLILTMMVVPWVGKYFGRKFAFWSWSLTPLEPGHWLMGIWASYYLGWARYMEWMHNVEIRWTSKIFKVTGAIEAAATL